MHELSVAQGIVEACSERAGGARVLAVTLEVGALTCVLPESLQFCYDVVAAGTALEGSRLEIVRIPARSRCRACAAEVLMQDVLATCRACGSTELDAPSGGEGLRIRSIEVSESESEVL